MLMDSLGRPCLSGRARLLLGVTGKQQEPIRVRYRPQVIINTRILKTNGDDGYLVYKITGRGELRLCRRFCIRGKQFPCIAQ